MHGEVSQFKTTSFISLCSPAPLAQKEVVIAEEYRDEDGG